MKLQLASVVCKLSYTGILVYQYFYSSALKIKKDQTLKLNIYLIFSFDLLKSSTCACSCLNWSLTYIPV